MTDPTLTDWTEQTRIAELTRLAILDTPPEQGFDDAVALVRLVCDVPIALVSLVDHDRQWFKAASGVTFGQTARDTSVCSLAIGQSDVFTIPDLSADPRTASMSLVTGPEQIRFYAGVPLVTANGITIGTLCAIDTVARPEGLTDKQRDGLQAIGRSVTALINARMQAKEQEHRHALAIKNTAALETMLEAQRRIWPLTGAEPIAAGRERAVAIDRAPDRAALFSAIQATRMPMILTDPHQDDNPIIFANRAFLALSGYSEEQLMGRNCRFLQGEGTDPNAVRRVREAIAARETIAIDILNYRSDGSTFVNELYVSPVFDGDGNLLYFFGSQVDVTSLTQARADLRDSEAKYRSLFEAMDEGFCIIEFIDGPHGPLSDYVHVEANAAYERNAGIPNVVGQKVREMVPDEADSWVARYGEVLRTGEPIRFEQELVATGRLLELSAFRLEPPERRQVAVLFKDVTARHSAEAALRDSEELIRSVLESSTDCIKVLELDGGMEFMSPQGQGLMEIDDFDALRGRAWPTIMGSSAEPAAAAIAIAGQGKTTHFECEADTAKGTPKWWSNSVSPVFDGNGRISRILAVSRDHTELHQARERQELLNGELSHRLKNTLSVIQAIAFQTLSNAGNQDAVAAFGDRLAALSKAHDVLTHRSWSATDMASVSRNVLASFDEGNRIDIFGTATEIGPRATLSLSLLLHELATNATKYGALSVPDGQVALSWAWNEEKTALVMCWKERGGPPAVEPSRRGFGSRVIRMGIAGSGGTMLHYGEEGLTAEMKASAAQLQQA